MRSDPSRTGAHAELEGLRRLRNAGPIDRRLLERRVRAVVADWRGLMGRQISESRRLLKGFLEGRVVFTPQPQRDVVDFVGRVRIGCLLAGAVVTTVGGVPDGTLTLFVFPSGHSPA